MALKDKIKIIPRRLIKDERGWFLKVITGTEDNIPDHTGEVYLTMGKPGQTKGGHYHPKAVEWFTLISGKAVLKLEDVQRWLYLMVWHMLGKTQAMMTLYCWLIPTCCMTLLTQSHTSCKKRI